MISGTTADAFVAALQGRTIRSAERKGKHLWLVLDTAPHVTFHLGMTGFFAVRGVDGVKYKRLDTDATEWPPNFSKVQLQLADGTQVAFSDARRLARVRLSDDPRGEPPISELGFDPLQDDIPEEVFFERLRARDVPVKVALMDQSFTAGVGNWIADEVLYQARMHPGARSGALSREQTDALLRELRGVVRLAVDAGADSDKFPRTWLFHYRWSKRSAGVKDGHGHAIQFVTIGGRTTAFVPALQGRGPNSAAPALRRSETAPAAGTGAAKVELDATAADGETSRGGRARSRGRAAAAATSPMAPRGAKAAAAPRAAGMRRAHTLPEGTAQAASQLRAGEALEDDAAPPPTKQRRRRSAGTAVVEEQPVKLEAGDDAAPQPEPGKATPLKDAGGSGGAGGGTSRSGRRRG